MSLKDLQLEQINLTSGPDKIKLRVATVLQLGVPTDIAQAANEEILLSLASGKLWATRGASCSLDFYIDLEDEELYTGSWNHLVESLGHRIRDTHLWSQLFLSTSLDIPQRDDSTKFSFSVRLGHNKPPLSSVLPPGDWLAGNIDVQPPDGVRRATVEGLQIRLNVQPISVKPGRPSKKLKPADTAGNPMILDSSLETFEGIVTNLSESLPLAVTNGFGLFGSEDPYFDSLLLDEPSLWNHHRLSFRDNFGASEDMLLAPTEVLFSPLAAEDDMLLSESADSVPPLLSQTSTLSTLSFQSSVSLKRSKPPNFPLITARPVHRLVEVAVHTLLEGYQLRRSEGFRTIVAEPPNSTYSLSKLCPGIFNLGFKEGMASNNQFLTSITRTISVSWPRNVQSPSLRRKLAQLGNRGDNEHDDDRKDVDTSSLSIIVSGRLWAMMQTKLHISSFSRKLAWDPSTDKEDMVHDDSLDNYPADPDILGEGYEKTHDFEDLLGDDVDEKDYDEAFLEFEDLLADDGSSDDGLLDCLAERQRERMEIENGTDDMLFGYAGGYDGEGEGQDEPMMSLEDGEDEGSEKCMLI